MGKRYFDYYGEVMKEGKLSEREKALIALAVATTQRCPYCIDAYTDRCLSLGVSREEMMEAVHVGAAMVAGVRPGSRYADAEDRQEKGNVRVDVAMVAPPFEEKVSCQVRAMAVDVLQVNLGYRCNLECRHCHVEAGPQRQEAMPAEVMEQCVKVFSAHSIHTLDITGGSPEMHPRLRWLLESMRPFRASPCSED